MLTTTQADQNEDRLGMFLAEAAVMGGNLEASFAPDGASALVRMAAAPERRFLATLDESGEPRLREVDWSNQSGLLELNS